MLGRASETACTHLKNLYEVFHTRTGDFANWCGAWRWFLLFAAVLGVGMRVTALEFSPM